MTLLLLHSVHENVNNKEMNHEMKQTESFIMHPYALLLIHGTLNPKCNRLHGETNVQLP